MLRPINDLCKVQVSGKKKFIEDNKDTSESGILVELPDQFNYFGFWSFAFEGSFVEKDKLDKLHDYWKEKIGYKVFWTALSEKGNTIKEGDEVYVFVKLTSLIAYDDDPDSEARNIHGSGAGAFKV